jgi:DNA-binding transcriptional MerR regulator
MSEDSETQGELMGIKDVAAKTGLPQATIRYYDQQFEEFLGVKRGAGRRRQFTPQAVERLLQIRRLLKDEGLSLRQARTRLTEGSSAPTSDVTKEIDSLRKEIKDLRLQVDQLRQIQMRTLALVDGLTGSS